MSTDFNFKPDGTIIQAFQNAQQQKMQAEEQARQEEQRSFNRTKETATAIGGLVSSFVDAAERKKTQSVMEMAKNMVAEKGAKQIPVQGPLPMGVTEQPTITDTKDVATRKMALDLMQRTNPKQLADTVNNVVFPETANTQSKRYQQGTAEVDGVPLLIKFDTQTGEYESTDGTPLRGKQIRGFKPTVTTDPNTAELVTVGAAGTSKPVTSNTETHTNEVIDPIDLTVKQSNRLKELQKEFQDDDLVKTNRMSLNSLNNLKTVQAEGTGALIGALQSLRARGIAGEKGVLTEQDVLRTTGSPALARRFSNAFTKLVLGEENKENLAEFNSAIASVEKAAINRNKKIEEDFIKRARSSKDLRNVADDLIRSNISIGTDSFEVPEAKPQEEAPKPGAIKSIEDARKLTPEQRRARIAVLQAQQEK